MKFTAVLVFIFPLLAQANVAWFPYGKTGANMNYADKVVCEATEGTACYDFGNCPADECSVVAGSVVPDSAKKSVKDGLKAAEDALKLEKKAAYDRLKAIDWTKAKDADAIKILEDVVKYIK